MTGVEEKLLLGVMETMLEATKVQDMAQLESFAAEDFEHVTESDEEALIMDYATFAEAINEWLYQLTCYEYKIADHEVYRLENGEGYGVTATITDMYFVDDIYEREENRQTWFIRNTPQGFKVFRLVVHD